MRGALVNTTTHVVENGIVYAAGYTPPDGYLLIQTEIGGPGDTYDGTHFIPAPPPDDAP